ncbi:MAG: hypothetical protein R3A47_04670 [Polyangiales bacterium]
MKRLKLYDAGLLTETDDDIDELIDFSVTLKNDSASLGTAPLRLEAQHTV